VGAIRRKLEELDLTNDTIIVFTSDNGGEDRVTSNEPLRAGKSTLYEGGIREPLIVYWPGVTPPAGTCDRAVCTMDFYPTFAEIAGSEAKQTVDGLSLVPLLKDPETRLARDALYWHYPLDKPHFLGGRSTGAIRQDGWKLIEFFDTGQIELYYLPDDPGEQKDIAPDKPGKRTELLEALHSWQSDAGAAFPEGQGTQNR
jgi:arylsulfatase A-like enzyme